MDDLGKKIAQILHETSPLSISSRGYNPETVERILALFVQQKQELLTKLTIEKKDYIWECDGDIESETDTSHLLYGTCECSEHPMTGGHTVQNAWNACVDELEQRKKEL